MAFSFLPPQLGSGKNTRPIFQSLHSEIDRVFDEFREGFDLKPSGISIPKIDISETDELIEVSADLPGIKEDDIDVTISNKVLIIKGETSEEREENEKNYHLVERSKDSYMRSIPIGFDVDEDQVKATVKDGVLNISINKPTAIIEKTKKIPITQAS